MDGAPAQPQAANDTHASTVGRSPSLTTSDNLLKQTGVEPDGQSAARCWLVRCCLLVENLATV